MWVPGLAWGQVHITEVGERSRKQKGNRKEKEKKRKGVNVALDLRKVPMKVKAVAPYTNQ